MKKSKYNELVTLYCNNEPRVSTNLLWKGFGYSEHRYFKDIITKNKKDFEQRGEIISVYGETNIKTRKVGKPSHSYLLNQRQFIYLIMLCKNTTESKILKSRVEIEFDRMQKTLQDIFTRNSNLEWKEARHQIKISTLEKNDIVKKYVEYAKGQGSTHSNFYYMSLAKCENSALFFIEPKLKNIREIANIKQLGKIKVADGIIEDILGREMEKGTKYKDIYKIVDQKLKDFSDIVGKSQIVLFQEQLELKKLNNVLTLQ